MHHSQDKANAVLQKKNYQHNVHDSHKKNNPIKLKKDHYSF